MNSKIMAVIRREFTTRVHTKTFILTTLLLPVLLLIIAVVPAMLISSTGHTTQVAVVDGTGGPLGQRVAQVLGAEKLDGDEDKSAGPRYQVEVVPAAGKLDSVRQRLIGQTGFSKGADKGKYDGVLVLNDGVLESGELDYYGSNASSPMAMMRLQRSLSKAFAATRLADAGIDVSTVGHAMRPVDLAAKRVSDGKLTGQTGHGAYYVAYIMSFVLYLAIMLFGQQTMMSVVEEKTSRVMEVLVSSLTPFQMLMGKVLGVGAAGLLQMAIWGASAWLITSQASSLGALVGVDPATLASFTLPSISASLVVVFLLYFALGFLVYGALYAAIGSMCNSIQETQQYATAVTVLIMIGFLAVFGIIANPDGTLGSVMSWIPFFAPFVMPVRWSLTSVSMFDLIGSLVLMVIGMWFCVWLAARIYHTGILMYGKKPSWRELWRWIRVS